MLEYARRNSVRNVVHDDAKHGFFHQNWKDRTVIRQWTIHCSIVSQSSFDECILQTNTLMSHRQHWHLSTSSLFHANVSWSFECWFVYAEEVHLLFVAQSSLDFVLPWWWDDLLELMLLVFVLSFDEICLSLDNQPKVGRRKTGEHLFFLRHDSILFPKEQWFAHTEFHSNEVSLRFRRLLPEW